MQPELAWGAVGRLTLRAGALEAASGRSQESILANCMLEGAWREPLGTSQGGEREGARGVCVGGRPERHAGENHTRGEARVGHAGRGG